MGKRILVMIVGAGLGSMIGLLVAFLGAGNSALIVGGIIGALVPLVVLGKPAK